MEITFDTILTVLRKSIVLLLVFAIIAGGCAFLASKFLLTPTYVSTVKLNIIGTQQKEGLVEENNSWVYANKIIKTCVGILQTNDFKERVREEVGMENKPSFTIAFDENTTIIEIKAQNSDREVAYKIAEAISNITNEHLVKMSLSSVTVMVIEQPVRAEAPSSPNATLNAMLSAVIAFAMVLVIQILREVLGTKVKDEDELQKRYELPVIATIPDFNEALRQSSKYSYTEYTSRGNK